MKKYLNKINQALRSEKAKYYFNVVNNPCFSELGAKMFFVEKITRLRRLDKKMALIKTIDWDLKD